jgi:hypothetical protein
VVQRTVPDEIALAGESPSAVGGPGGPFRRVCHPIRCASKRQRVRTGRFPSGRRPNRPPTSSLATVAARSADPRGPRQRGWERLEGTPLVACEEPLWLSACHPVFKAQLAFRSPTLRHQGCRLPRTCAAGWPPRSTAVTNVRDTNHHPPLLHGRDISMTCHKIAFPLVTRLRPARRWGRRAPRSAIGAPSPP